MKKIVLGIMMMACAFATAQTGYVNSQQIIAELPEVIKADSTLKELSSRLQADISKREKNKESKMQDLAYEMQNPKVTQERAEEIRKLAMEMEKEVATANKLDEIKLATTKNELLEPVYDKVNEAVSKVAKKRGFKLVVDISAVLFAEEDLNITADVRKELGLVK